MLEAGKTGRDPPQPRFQDEKMVYAPRRSPGKSTAHRRCAGSRAPPFSPSTTPRSMELARYAVIIEKHYGRPMDIEWGKDGNDGKLHPAGPPGNGEVAGRPAQRLQKFKG